MIRAGLTVLDKREATLDTVESIERTSIDFYATTRSLYRQEPQCPDPRRSGE